MAKSKSLELFKKLKKLKPGDQASMAQRPDTSQLLSTLTPTQYAALFPKTPRGRPDVGGFDLAITKKSQEQQRLWQESVDSRLDQQGGMMSRMRKQYGGGGAGGAGTAPGVGGSSGSGGGASVPPNKMAKQIYDYLRTKGVDHNHAIGMIANISKESNFNPSSYNKNDVNGPSGGLFQHHSKFSEGDGGRFNDMVRFVGADWRTNPNAWKKQIDFALQERQTKIYLSKRFDNATDASRDFTINWEVPDRKEAVADQRAKYVSGFEKMVSGPSSLDKNGNPLAVADGSTGRGAGGGSAPDFSKYIMHDRSMGDCGKGVRKLAGHMMGHSAFINEGLSVGSGGSALAGSLSQGNNYFQRSGLYKSGRGIGSDHLTGDYLDSLPIGTVISSTKAGAAGHVQIKIGPGQWASDFSQKGFIKNGYDNFVVHEPNEAGLARLAENGVTQGGSSPGTGELQVEPRQTAEVPRTAIDQSVAVAEIPDEETAPAKTIEEKKKEEAAPQQQEQTQTASVVKPEKAKEEAPKVFSINRQGLINAVKQTDEFKNTFGSSLATDDMIYNGFMDHEKTKQLMADTNSSIDSATGKVTIGDYKKFQKLIGMDTSKILVADNVPSHAGGGREKVRGKLSYMPISPIRGDDTFVSDQAGNAFTINRKREKIVSNSSDTVQIKHRDDLGTMSAIYESGKKGVENISTGKNDPGGVSYGSHQLSSKAGTMSEYLKSPEAAKYADRFKGLKPATAAFNNVYTDIAKSDPEGFRRSQEDYITRTHYEPVYVHAKKMGFNVDDPRVQEALYSMSVQHGGAKTIVGRVKNAADKSPEEQVKDLFSARKQYVAKNKQNFDTRYNAEQKDILAMDTSKYKQTDVAPTKMAQAPGAAPEPEQGISSSNMSLLSPSSAKAKESMSTTPGSMNLSAQPTPHVDVKSAAESAGISQTPRAAISSVSRIDPGAVQPGKTSQFDLLREQMSQGFGAARAEPPAPKKQAAAEAPDFQHQSLISTQIASARDPYGGVASLQRAGARSAFGAEGFNLDYGNKT